MSDTLFDIAPSPTHGCAGAVCGVCHADTAVRHVGNAAAVDWLTTARQWITDLPPGYRFTTDELWHYLGGTDLTTHEPRALGAVIRGAKTAGEIRGTGRYVTSIRPECHARPIPVWERVNE